MDNIAAPENCPRCGHPVLPDAFFCSNCGKQIKSKPESLSVGRQAVVYLVSFFLAPFGLAFVFKYLKQPGKAKYVGIVAIALTFISIGITFWTAKAFLEYSYRDIRALNGLLY